MSLQQFTLIVPADNIATTASLPVEAGTLESVTAILENPAVVDLPTFVHIFIAGGDAFPSHLVATLASGYINALNPAAWTGEITAFPSMRIVCRAQSESAQTVRIGLLTSTP
jgi:hypothetical protein